MLINFYIPQISNKDHVVRRPLKGNYYATYQSSCDEILTSYATD